MLHKGSQQNWYSGLVMRESVQLHFCDVQGSGLHSVLQELRLLWKCLCDCSEHLSFPAANTEQNTCTLGRKIKDNDFNIISSFTVF